MPYYIFKLMVPKSIPPTNGRQVPPTNCPQAFSREVLLSKNGHVPSTVNQGRAG
jgi:hypothetical protein